MKALIVDDNSEFRALLRYQFETHGWEAVEAADGQEGLEKGAKHKPDLIVSDALMPRMDGFQFLKKAKKDTELKSVPFVFYSSVYTGKKEEELALSLGAAKFIVKPKEPEEFWREIESVVEKGALKEEAVRELVEEDEEFLRRYAHIVAAKLEEKVEELEKEISEHERAEEGLKESELRFRTIFDNAIDGILLADPQSMKFYTGNKSICRMLNYQQEEITNLSITDIHPQESLPYVMDQFSRQAAGEITIAYDIPVKRKDNIIFYCDINSSSITIAGKKYLMGIFRDVTERRQVEAALKQMNEMLEQKVTHLAILNQLDRAILSNLKLQEVFKTLDSGLPKIIGYDSLHIGILENNELRSFAFVKGRETKEYKAPIKGSSMEKMIAAPSPLLRKDLELEKSYYEDEILLKRGLRSYVLLPLVSKGKLIGSLGLAAHAAKAYSEKDVELLETIANQVAIAAENAGLYQDLEKKVAQRTLELALQNKELQELAKTREEFLSTASHDLRAPLTGVLGFAELLLMGKAGSLPDLAKRYIQTIHKSGKSLLTIIEDYLEITRIDAGKIQLHLQAFNLAEGISLSLASMEPLFVSKKIPLTVDIEEELPLAYADPNRFSQMLTNLLSNALKFTPEDGKVTIRAERTTETGEGRQETGRGEMEGRIGETESPQPSAISLQPKFIKVSVIDTGIGISPEDQKRLFERFFRAESTKYSVGGTGLGLPIVKELAEAHEGTVGVESEPKKGSTFWFTLPVFRKESEKKG